ncbi:MAG: hypothetical protein H6922_04945 [Pseudomonadaceae bacterium]|nr:hypothetical protein [Pseudomonadaceae bacterium]
MFRLFGGVLTLAILAWAALYFSGKAVLFHEGSPRESGVMRVFSCKYFDGMKVLNKEQAYSDIPMVGQVGSARCPRLIDVDGIAAN